MYHVGETEADIREGQDFPKLWAKWHYDWSTPNSVTLTVVESDAMAPGGFMTFDRNTSRPRAAAPCTRSGSRRRKNLRGLIAVTMMRFIGPRFLSSYYKKVYDGLAAG